MSTLGERLKKLREDKDFTLEYVANKLGTTKVSISRYEKNEREPKGEMLKSLAEFFNVTTDYLLGRDAISNNIDNIELNDKDKKDIEKQFQITMSSLESQDGLMFNGNPVDEEDWELLKAAIQNGLEYAKKMNKAKYTPKKYRK